MQSYDSLFGSMSRSDSEGGSAGRTYAGPRVRVRRGRRGKFPSRSNEMSDTYILTCSKLDYSSVHCCESEYTDNREVGLVKEDRMVCLMR